MTRDKRDGKADALYICYWSLQDPLCQTQSLAYLRGLAARGHRFALITFEQPKYKLNSAQRAAMRRELKGQGIYWYPLKYHKRFPILATAYDCLRAILVGAFVVLRHRPRIVHSRASIPASVALALSRVCGLKFLYDADSRLSEEYADNGHWSRTSRAFKMTAGVEAMSRRRADSIVVLSERLRDDFIGEFQVRAPIEVIPCCVDLDGFHFNERAREARRRELGLNDEKLLVYAGKTGERYLTDEMFEFFKVARERIKDSFLAGARLLVLTGDDPEIFHRIARRHLVDASDYYVRHSSRQEMPEWLSASDAGLAFIRTVPCERGSSPVKIGEYLACGLPVVVTDGIGDYSNLIARARLGAVIERLDDSGYLEAADAMAALWREGERLQSRCRAAAEANVSLKSVAIARYEAVYRSLLADAGAVSESGRPSAID
ncbi:MAG: glycosyltransferase [Blastocatellia bacterium]|nr:glycosyltransferase [Blastocatellia bacterium]